MNQNSFLPVIFLSMTSFYIVQVHWTIGMGKMLL